MWIISVDTPYYPYIIRRDTYEEAKEEYDYEKNNLDDEGCIYISEVNDVCERENYTYRSID